MSRKADQTVQVRMDDDNKINLRKMASKHPLKPSMNRLANLLLRERFKQMEAETKTK